MYFPDTAQEQREDREKYLQRFRNEFAASVLPAIYAEAMKDYDVLSQRKDWRDVLAQGAYKMADAMVKASKA